jgi:hypothetical protein
MPKQMSLYDRIKEPYRQAIIDSLDQYPKGASKVIETLRSKQDPLKLTIEEMLDMGTFAFHPEDNGKFTKRSQHAVYAFCEQFFNQVETKEHVPVH